jgi:cob(I)alamin adenosyltransferase
MTDGKKTRRTGMIIVNTGDGKGKTTAALGVLMRAWGRGWNICIVQFLKHEKGKWGEVRAFENFERIDWIKTGDGFTWTSKDMDETIAKALHGWEVAKEKIASDAYDLVILDEFTYPMALEWIDTAEVIDWLKANKPPRLHVIITGRDAPEALIDYADLVTEMVNVKHPYDEGIEARAGIDF